MKRIIPTLLLLTRLNCGVDCFIQGECNIQHDMSQSAETQEAETLLKKTGFYNYVIDNIKQIKFVDQLNFSPGARTGKAADLDCCCMALVSKYIDEYKRNYREIAGTLVHEAAHCESKSSDEAYADKKEGEFYELLK